MFANTLGDNANKCMFLLLLIALSWAAYLPRQPASQPATLNKNILLLFSHRIINLVACEILFSSGRDPEWWLHYLFFVLCHSSSSSSSSSPPKAPYISERGPINIRHASPFRALWSTPRAVFRRRRVVDWKLYLKITNHHRFNAQHGACPAPQSA